MVDGHAIQEGMCAGGVIGNDTTQGGALGRSRIGTILQSMRSQWPGLPGWSRPRAPELGFDISQPVPRQPEDPPGFWELPPPEARFDRWMHPYCRGCESQRQDGF